MHTKISRLFRSFWGEARLAFFARGTTYGPNTSDDESAFENMEAKEGGTEEKIETAQEGASAILSQRNRLITKVQSANKSGFLRGWIPLLSPYLRGKQTEKIVTDEAFQLARETSPELAAKNRLKQFLTLGAYRDAMFLAHVQKTRKELIDGLIASVEGAKEQTETRMDKLSRMRQRIAAGPLTMDAGGRTQDEIRDLFSGNHESVQLMNVTDKSKQYILDSLKFAKQIIDADSKKYKLDLPAPYKLLLQKELDLKTALDAAKIVPLGEEMDALIEDHRNAGSKLIRAIKNGNLNPAERAIILFKAREIQGNGAVVRMFKEAPNNYYEAMRQTARTVNVLPLTGRLKHLHDAEDINLLYQYVEVQLPGDKRRRMIIKRREKISPKGSVVWLEETAPQDGRRRKFLVNTLDKRVTRKDERGNFIPPAYLTETDTLLFV